MEGGGTKLSSHWLALYCPGKRGFLLAERAIVFRAETPPPEYEGNMTPAMCHHHHKLIYNCPMIIILTPSSIHIKQTNILFQVDKDWICGKIYRGKSEKKFTNKVFHTIPMSVLKFYKTISGEEKGKSEIPE